MRGDWAEFLDRERLVDEADDAGLIERCLFQMRHPASDSSLLMEHTGLRMPDRACAGRGVLLIDAGGTNLRIARGVADGFGGWSTELLQRAGMPGAKAPVSSASFFRDIARAAAPFHAEGMSIGFCFSYTLRHLPDGDAEVLSLAKQVQIRDLKGKRVGRELAAALRGVSGESDAKVTVLNDAPAVLLAGSLPCHRNKARAAIIMGTGVNFALFAPDAVNVEASRFNGFPRTEADLEMDRKTSDPGQFPFEKSTSGRYLGDLVLTVAQRAARAGCFSAGAAETLRDMATLSTERLSAYLEDAVQDRALSQDALVFSRISDAVIDRAARRIAIFATAVLEHAGATRLPGPAVLQMEGGTIEKFQLLRRKTLSCLEDIARERGFSFEPRQLKGAVLMGTAAAAAQHIGGNA